MKKLLLFILLVCIKQVNAQTCYSFRTDFLVASSAMPISIAIADFNGDGKNDIATVNDYISTISVKLGDGVGGFGTAISRATGGTPIDMAVADYNNDGIMDMAVVNKATSAINVSILIGTGMGSFNLLTNLGPGGYPGTYVDAYPPHITTGDFNGDNNADIAIGWEKGLIVYLGTGSGAFGSPASYLSGTEVYDVVAKDFNNDGKMDLGAPSGSFYILLGNGTGGFTLTSNTPSSNANPFAVNDFNQDNIPDVIVPGINQKISVYLGVGDGTLGTPTDYTTNMSQDVTSLASTDINSDGYADVIALDGGSADNLAIMLGNGTGALGTPIIFSEGNEPQYVTCGNLNGDNKPDIAFADYFQYGYVTAMFQLTPPIAVNISGSSTTCSGNSTTLTASGSAFHYTWSANAGSATTSTVSITPTISDTYTVTGVNGTCVNTQTISVTVNTTPTVNISGTATICSGNSDTLTAIGATTYSWSANAASATTNSVIFTPTVSATYSVTGTTGSCSNTKTFPVTVYSLNVTGTTSICTGSSTTLTASGSTSYTWMPGGMTTNSIVVNPTTTTVYTITGVAGTCNFVKTVIVTVNSPSTPTATASSYTICSGTATTLIASGSLSYTWVPGSITTATTSVSPATTTTYTLTGKNGTCPVVTTTIAILVNNSLSVNSSSICIGSTTTLTATGSSTNYVWNTGASGSTIVVSPTVTTSYTITGTDNNSCSLNKVATVTVNTFPSVSIVGNPYQTVCTGKPVAGITFSVTPSTAQVGWANNNTTTGLAASNSGNINGFNAAAVSSQQISVITITNVISSQGCQIVPTNGSTYTLTVNPKPIISITTNTACLGALLTNTLTASGANTYTWSTGSISPAITASPTITTNYTVTGTDVNSCVNTSTTSIHIYNNVLNISSSETNSSGGSGNNTPNIVACQGSVVQFAVSGGSNYIWNTGATGSIFTDSPSVTTSYTVTALDTNGCWLSKVATASIIATPTVNIIGNNYQTVCAGAQVAPITFSVLPSSTYANWSNNNTLTGLGGSNTGNINGFSAAAVTSQQVSIITISAPTPSGCPSNQANQLTYTLTVNPQANTPISASSFTLCSGGVTTATLTASGAQTYTWNTAATGPVITPSPTSTTIYTVTGTDANSCVITTTASVVVTSSLSATVITATTSPVCIGNTTNLVASGASSYTWSTGAVGNTLQVSPVTTTNYTLLGTDANNCVSLYVASVTVNPLPTLTATNGTICAGQSYTLAASGANTYTYSGGNQIVSPITQTIYTITGTDNNGCIGSVNDIISVNQLPILTVTNETICAGATTTLTASGANTYTWNTSETGASISPSPTVTTNYTVTGTSGNGCTNTNSSTVTVNPVPAITISSTDISCNGLSDGTATASVSGGSPLYSYTWSPSGGNNATANNLNVGNYSVTVTDINTCVNSATVLINQPTILSISATQTAKDCGSDNGQATGVVSGGNPVYSYTWNPTSQTLLSATGLAGGITYTFIVSDANGCIGSASVFISDSCDMVWAGDANNDLVADNNDILAIGIGNSTSGITRTNASINWTAQPAVNWTNTLADGTNYKHIDCDGNGSIDLNDTVAVIQNFTLTHPASRLTNPNQTYSGGTPITLVPQQNYIIECINLNTGQIKVKGKGNKERIIQVCNKEAIRALKEYYKLFNSKIKKQGDYFFINRFNTRLSEQSVRFLVKKYAKIAGLERRITPHSFRHSFATLLLEQDVDIKYIQHLLGHSSIMTTQIYTHVNGEKQKQILQRHPRRNFSIKQKVLIS